MKKDAREGREEVGEERYRERHGPDGDSSSMRRREGLVDTKT